MKKYHFRLDISRDEMLRYYSGKASVVAVRAHSGQTVRFPASALLRHVDSEGVNGTFTLVADDNNRLVTLERWSDPGRRP